MRGVGEVVGTHDREAAVGERFLASGDVVSLEADDQWNADVYFARGRDDAVGDDVTVHDAAEDIDENAADVWIAQDDLKGGRDLFFRRAAVLNRADVPGSAMIMQGAWASVLITLRTYNSTTGAYGNLYSNLLDYVVSAALIFYILTIYGVYRLRKIRPDADRPYRAIGYPILPALYIAGAAIILGILFLYRPATTVPGLIIVLLGIPVYIPLRRSAAKRHS